MFEIQHVTRIARARTLSEIPGAVCAEVAFAGRSNVGKSSLINSLLQRRNLVRTSNTPGCTRTLDFYELQLKDAGKVHFVDLPGYGYAQRSKQEMQRWQGLIEGYFENRKALCTAVVILDMRHGVVDSDEQLLQYLRSLSIRSLVAATKLDKIIHAQKALEINKLGRTLQELGVLAKDYIAYSSKDHDGREALWAAIIKHATSQKSE